MTDDGDLVGIDIGKTFEKLMENEEVQKGLNLFKEYHEDTVKEQIEICEIPAPPFKEETRAKEILKRFKNLGTKDAEIDGEGNVLATIKGSEKGPKLVIAAHLDTVFPEGTDTRVREKDGILYAPGIGDNTRGLAELLTLLRVMKKLNIKPQGDIVLCATVGEEGEGDLRGVKYLFENNKDIDGFVALDGNGTDSLVYLGKGSKRYRVEYEGPGGHSSGAFGNPSAIHAMGRAIGEISNIRVNSKASTYTVGLAQGGSAVNAIAERATMSIDMRSNNEEELLELESKLLKIIEDSVKAENEFWDNPKKVEVQLIQIGDRPSGQQSPDSTIVKAAEAAIEAIGLEARLKGPSSTDSNIPIALKVPAVTLGRGGKGGKVHTLEEWFDPTDSYLSPQRAFLLMLALVGVCGLTEPLLKLR